MDKYIVSISRTAYGGLDFEVAAASEEEAQEAALELATSTVFTSHESNYHVDQIIKVKPDTVTINGVEMRDCMGLHHDD